MHENVTTRQVKLNANCPDAKNTRKLREAREIKSKSRNFGFTFAYFAKP